MHAHTSTLIFTFAVSLLRKNRPNRQHEPEPERRQRRPEDEALCGQELRFRNEGPEEVP